MKESLYSPANSGVVFRETFNSEEAIKRNGGINSGVTLSNGEGTFDGATSKIDYGQVIRNTRSIRINLNLTSTTTEIIKLTSSHSISITGGTISATGFSSPTIYVDGVATSTITTGSHQIIVTTATAITINALVIGQVSGYYIGTMDLLEIYNKALTLAEVQNLYNNTQHKGLVKTGLVAHYDLTQGDSTDRSGNGNNGTDTNMIYKKQGGEFDGTSGYIQLPDELKDTVTRLKDYTVEAVFKADDPAGVETIFYSQIDANNRNAITLDNNSIRTGIYTGTWISKSISFTDKTNYNHISMTATGNTPTSYLNYSTLLSGTTAPSTLSGNNVAIGVTGSLTLFHFDGSIKTLSIYNRALTDRERAQNYQYAKTRFLI